MDITIYPNHLSGCIAAIPSKSQAHRLLICAAFADQKTTLVCPDTNQDIEATASCLRALGADIIREADGYTVTPIGALPQYADLPCGESGSTLRFMLPIVGALGIEASLQMKGRLSKRPLSPLWEEMERMGCCLSRPTPDTIHCSGQLKSGNYYIDGSVSSQFITGLLFAAALMKGTSNIHITGKLESAPYVIMTQNALSLFGVASENFTVVGHLPFSSPGKIIVEGDWSNGAFFLAAKALGSDLILTGLDLSSSQGDRAVLSLLDTLKNHAVISVADIPDLVPILSVVAAANQGAVFTQVQRLRLKESDRVCTVAAMLASLGIKTEITESTLSIYPGKFHGGTVDAANDHRIAMSAAVAATISEGPVTIIGAQCVAKSYPTFWEEYQKLGGNYEQYIR